MNLVPTSPPFAVLPVIVSTNYKGGVGKTTSSRVLAQTLALMPEFHRGRPILVIDLDPQANTSKRWQLSQLLADGSKVPIPHPELLDASPNYSSICDIWADFLSREKDAEAVAPLPYKTSNPLIEVVPADEVLMNRAMRVSDEILPKLGAAMRAWLRDPVMLEQYCCAIIDTQPSKTPLIEAALAAATHVYIPFVPEPQSLDGVYSIISYVYSQTQNRRNDVPLKILGLLPNLVQRVTLHRSCMKQIESNPTFVKYLMPVKIMRRISYAESDDPRNIPGQVTDIVGADIEIEAKKFARFVAEAIDPSVKGAKRPKPSAKSKKEAKA